MNADRKRKFRGKKKRPVVDDDDDDDDAPPVSVLAAQKKLEKEKAKQRKKKDAKEARSARLSFMAEEEEASSARQCTAKKKVAAPVLSAFGKPKKPKTSGSAPGGAYSAEALRALQAESFQFGAAPVHVPAADEADDGAEAAPPPGQEFLPRPLGQPGAEDDGEGDGEGGGDIPDGERIARAKEKRERLRRLGSAATTAGGGGEGFIPLDAEAMRKAGVRVPDGSAGSEKMGAKGRLQRGDVHCARGSTGSDRDGLRGQEAVGRRGQDQPRRGLRHDL